jgi:DNA-binding transcriptional ArsR family regulator
MFLNYCTTIHKGYSGRMTRRAGPSEVRTLVALASTVRQDIVVALEGSSPRTVAELAGRLGRRPDALYHHLRALERAGLVIAEPRPSTGGRPGSAWRLTMKVVRLPARAVTGSQAHHAERIVGAMVRSSMRDYRRALRAAEMDGEPRPSASRSSVWLDAGERRALERAIVHLVGRLRAKEPRRGRRPHVLTFVLAPAVEAARSIRRRSPRRRMRKERRT